MTTEPFKLDIAESFIDIKPRGDSFLDLPETDVDKLIEKEKTKKDDDTGLEGVTLGSDIVSPTEGLTDEQKNLLSGAEQFLKDEASKVSPTVDIEGARGDFLARTSGGTSNMGAAKLLDNVNNNNKDVYINNISGMFADVKDSFKTAMSSVTLGKEELKKSGMGPVVAGITGGPFGAVMAFAPLVADGFQQKKDMNNFLKDFGEKGFSDELLNASYSYGTMKNEKTGKQFLQHVLVNDFNPGYALKYNAYGGKNFDGNHHDALKKFIVDGVNEEIFNEGAILRLASQRYAFKTGSDNYWKATVAQKALKDLGYTVKGRTAIDSEGNTYLDGKLWKKAVDTNVPNVVSAGTSSNTKGPVGTDRDPTQPQQQVTGGGGADQDTSPSVSNVMNTDFVTKDESYYQNFNQPGGGFSQGLGLAFGGEPEPKANIGNLEFINEKGKDMSGVADDVERPLEEGDFVINAPAVEFAGKKDIEDMLEEAIAIAMARGFDISDERKGKLLTGLSNRELVIPKVLAEIIGYDRLNKINNRGKERVQEIVQARKEQIPEKPVADDPRLRAQLGGAVGSVLDSDVATGKLAAAGAPGEILSTPRGAFVNIAKPMPTAQVLQQTPIGEEILRPQSMMNVGGDVEGDDVKVEIKKKPKITQFELVRNNLSSSPYKLRNEAIAGILGNIAVETGETFDYRTSQMGGPGRGLFQFEGGHSRAYEDYKKANNLSPSIDAQVSYVLDNIYKGTGYDIGIKNRKDLQNIFATGTTTEIADAFAKLFERPNPEKAKYDKRIQRANEIFDMLYRPNPQKSFPLTMSTEDAFKDAYGNIDESDIVIGTKPLK